ncbi:MAG: SNARE associated Golgi protein [Gammaproteobacteria bacterium]|nr:SNARE associated Golgi protein [Gammaproteobacteria bacterium]
MTKPKLILLALLIAVSLVCLSTGLEDYLTLANFKASRAGIDAYFTAHPVMTGIIFIVVYVTLTSLSLPAAGILTLIGGAIFGFIWGLILVSLASSLGATCAFLLARYLFRDAVQKRFADRLIPVNAGIRKDGALYLFMLRMIPIFPFFVINATMALTPIKTSVFFPVSMIGMLPITAIMVNAGLQISKIEAPADILSFPLLVSLALIGIFPLLVKKIFKLYKQRNLSVTSE